MPPNLVRNADICIGVFSACEPETYEILKQQISKHEEREGRFERLAIVESFSDLIPREIEEETRKLATIEKDTGRKTFLVSSKDGTNVDQLLKWIVQRLEAIGRGRKPATEKNVPSQTSSCC
jgi:hypothetical protein